MHRRASIAADHWRTVAIVASALAALEFLLLVAAAVIFLAKPFAAAAEARGEARATATRDERTSRVRARIPRSETSVLVLNGNGVPGAAAHAAERARTLRYVIAGTANASGTPLARSLVMYRPGYQGEAERLARDLGIARVTPLDGLRASDLEGAHLALVVGERDRP